MITKSTIKQQNEEKIYLRNKIRIIQQINKELNYENRNLKNTKQGRNTYFLHLLLFHFAVLYCAPNLFYILYVHRNRNLSILQLVMKSWPS